MAIEPFGGIFDAKGTCCAIALCIEAKDQAHQFSINRINLEPLMAQL
jgi:hypothetical protein